MATYVRQSSFSDGDTITAALFNNEFNQLVNAFDVATGHTHDGSTAGDGGPISNLFSNALVFGTNTDNDVVITFNANSNDGVLTWMEDEDYFQFSDDLLLTTTEKVQFRDTAIYINSSTDGQLDIVADTEVQIVATTIDMNGNADISGNLGVGGNLTVTGTTTFNGGTITMGDAATDNVVFGADVDSNIIPDDDDTYDLGSSTQQWRNLYIDGTANIDSLVADTADINGGTIDAANITVGSGKTLDVSAGTITLADNQISGDKVEGGTINATTINTLTYGSITDGTITVTAFVDEDNMASNSATLIPTQQSVKAYVDAQDTAQDLDLVSDSGTIAIDLDGETLTVTGGEGIDTSASSNTLTITGEDATTSNKGIASFNSDDFNVSSGAVTLATTSTAAELNLLDGTTAGTIVASKGVAVDANKDITGFRNITLTGELDAGSLDVSGNVDVDGTLETDALSINGTAVTSTAAELNLLDGKAFLDEDNMASNSATGIASQQSIKAYVDTTVAATNEVVEDTSPQLGGDLASNGNDILFADSDKAIFGAGSDLQIYHDGSHSYIKDAGTGNLNIQANQLRIQSDTGENFIECVPDAQVVIRYNNDVKFQTTNTGIDVTGVVTATSLDISGDIDVDGTTNLDVVDIDGAVNMASTLTIGANSGVIKEIGSDLSLVQGSVGFRINDAASALSATTATGNSDGAVDLGVSNIRFKDLYLSGTVNATTLAGTLSTAAQGNITSLGTLTTLTVDDITINGSTISDAGDLTLDVAGVIVLDADNAGVIQLKDGGTHYGSFFTSSDALNIQSNISDGDIIFKGNDGGSAITALTLDMSAAGAATFNSSVSTPTLSSPDGTSIITLPNTGVASFGRGIVVNEAGLDSDFRVESSGNANMLFVDAGNDRIGIGHSAPATILDIHGTSPTLNIRDLTSAATGVGGAISFQGYTSGTGSPNNFGKIRGTKASGNVGGVLTLSTSATNGTMTDRMTISESGTAAFNAGATFNSNVAITTADNSDTLTLVSTDADANGGPILVFDRTSGSPANNDLIGQIEFQARNNAAQDIDYAGIDSYILDVTDGSEDGELTITTMVAGTTRNRLDFTNTQTIVNESGVDVDFRVESNNDTHMLFVDAGTDNVGIGTSTVTNSSGFYTLSINGSTGGQIAFQTNGTGKQYIYSTDTDLNMWNSIDGSLRFHTNNIERLEMSSAATIFNETGADVDFRVESNANSHMLFVDAGKEVIGIGTGTTYAHGKGSAIDIQYDATIWAGSTYWAGGLKTGCTFYSDQAGDKFKHSSRQAVQYYQSSQGGTHKFFSAAGGTADALISWQELAGFSRSEVVFNENSADQDFRVESNNNANMLFVDGGADRVVVGSNAGLIAAEKFAVRSTGGSENAMTVYHASTDDRDLVILMHSGATGSNSRKYLSFLNYNGVATGNVSLTETGTTYATTSDLRLKKDIKPITDGTDKLMAMNPVTHGWKADPEADNVYGFIAQEMMDIVPEAITGNPEGEEMMSMDYGRITPVIVAALQEANKKIIELENKINKLEAK